MTRWFGGVLAAEVGGRAKRGALEDVNCWATPCEVSCCATLAPAGRMIRGGAERDIISATVVPCCCCCC